MKKILVLSAFFCGFSAFFAQNINEMIYTEDGKNKDGFGFSNPVCSKDVLVKAWKDFIGQEGGKPKGGMVSKITGMGMKFFPQGRSWNGNFAYNYNEDQKDMTILTSFQDEQGNLLTSETTPEEISSVNSELEKFRIKVKRACISDDLTKAESYKKSLQREKSNNQNRIQFLEKKVQSNNVKISDTKQNSLKDSEVKKAQNMQARISDNQLELQALQERNEAIDSELPTQELVISDFQKKLNEIEKE